LYEIYEKEAIKYMAEIVVFTEYGNSGQQTSILIFSISLSRCRLLAKFWQLP